jgi:hypothetical protein
VTHYVIDVHHHTRTNPTGDTSIIHTRRTVVATEPGGPCTRPVRITSGAQMVMVSCARAVPSAQQCPACRVTITMRHTTTSTLGDRDRPATPAPSGLLKEPCPECGLPVAAQLADTGRHLLCPPPASSAGGGGGA